MNGHRTRKKVGLKSDPTHLYVFKTRTNECPARVARFFLVHATKTGKNVPNGYKLCQMSSKYSKLP
jgi:hypothetical protein